MQEEWEKIPLKVREMMIAEADIQAAGSFAKRGINVFVNDYYELGDNYLFDAGFTWSDSTLGKEDTTGPEYAEAWDNALCLHGTNYTLWEEIYGPIVSYTVIEQNGETFNL